MYLSCDVAIILILLCGLLLSLQLVVVPAGDSDDLYILQYARMHQAFVLSNDFFADHVRSLPGEEAAAEATVWLEQFRCPYTFIKTAGGRGGGKGGVLMPSPASAMMDLLEKYRRSPGGGGEDKEDEMEMDTVI